MCCDGSFCFPHNVVGLHSTSFNIVQLNIQHHPLNHPLNPPSILFCGFPLKHTAATGFPPFSALPGCATNARVPLHASWLRASEMDGHGGMVGCSCSVAGNSWSLMRLNFPKPPCNCHSNQGALAEWSRIETWRLSSLGHVKACPTWTLETQAFRPSPLSHGLRTAQENMQKRKHKKHKTHSLNTLSDVRFP